MATTNIRGTVSELDALSLEVFPGKDEIWDQIDSRAPALDLIEKTNRVPFFGKSDGKRIVLPLAVGETPNPAVGVAETGGLATAGITDTHQAYYNIATHNQALEMTGLAMDTLTGGEHSVQDVLTFNMRHQKDGARKEMNKMIHGDGSGLLATLSSTDGAYTAAIGTTDTAAAWPGQINTDGILVGSDLDIMVKTTGARLADSNSVYRSGKAVRVSAVTDSSHFTAQGEGGETLALAVGDSTYGIYRYGAQGNCLWGFGAIVSESNMATHGEASTYFGNINRSAYPWWRGVQTSAGGGTISVHSHIQPIIDELRRGADSFLTKDPDGFTWTAFCGYQNQRNIGNALAASRWTQGDSKKVLRGGWAGIEYEDVVFVVDPDCPPSRVRFIHTPSLRRVVNRPWFWNNKSGSIWRVVAADDGRDADVYRARLMTRQQLVTTRCKVHGEIYYTDATS